jgi:FG-GAP-like repeat
VNAIGDLDGDGCDDIVWRNSSNGSVSAWRMSGSVRATGGLVATNVSNSWTLSGMADLNGDGKDDLLWHNSSSHAVNGWQMDGFSKQGGGFIQTVPTGWSICKY